MTDIMADWNFWTPAEPIEPDGVLIKGERKRLIHGIAATEATDKHKEEMVLEGMDFKPYIESGHLNDDHMKGEQHILGKPLEAKLVKDAGEYDPKLVGKPGFYHICEFFDTEPGRAAWDNMQASRNDPKRQRGFSVEGAILQTRGPKLIKTRVEDVALTRKPANGETFAKLVKSLAYSDAPALGIQNLDDGTQTEKSQMALTGVDMDDLLWGGCDNNCFKKHSTATQGAYYHLVKCKGMGEDGAFSFVKFLKKNGLLD